MDWFTSDWHIGHANVLEYCPRPFFSIERMNCGLAQQWNIQVRPGDTVYMIGDLALAKFREAEPWLRQLHPGRKVLIKGNHDGYSAAQYASLGWEVYHELLLKIAGQMCRLSHYPYAPPWWRRLVMSKRELRYLNRRPMRKPGEILIHGHTHSPERVNERERRIHVGIDAWDYKLVSRPELERIVQRMGQC